MTKIYTVAADNYDDLDAAGAALWCTSFSTLASAKSAVGEDMAQYRVDSLDEEELTEDLPNFVVNKSRKEAYVLDDTKAGRTWYIQASELVA